jgi:hypothetical protein
MKKLTLDEMLKIADNSKSWNRCAYADYLMDGHIEYSSEIEYAVNPKEKIAVKVDMSKGWFSRSYSIKIESYETKGENEILLGEYSETYSKKYYRHSPTLLSKLYDKVMMSFTN